MQEVEQRMEQLPRHEEHEVLLLHVFVVIAFIDSLLIYLFLMRSFHGISTPNSGHHRYRFSRFR